MAEEWKVASRLALVDSGEFEMGAWYKVISTGEYVTYEAFFDDPRNFGGHYFRYYNCKAFPGWSGTMFYEAEELKKEEPPEDYVKHPPPLPVCDSCGQTLESSTWLTEV
jgi:hypothetical protein